MTTANYPVHPVAELFPEMDGESYVALKADIASHGLSEPIVLWKKQLIDGRHRLRACKELGVKPTAVSISDSDDPLVYVISHNLHRRHLTESQRAMVAAKIATLKPGEIGNGRKVGEQICSPTTADAAKQLSVSRRSVISAKQVLEHGSKAVQQAVEKGTLKVSTAAELATSGATKSEQTQAVKDGKEAIKVVLKKPAKKEKAPLSKEEQIKAEHKKARSYAEHLQRAIDDLNRIKRNTVVHPELIKLCGQILKGLERW